MSHSPRRLCQSRQFDRSRRTAQTMTATHRTARATRKIEKTTANADASTDATYATVTAGLHTHLVALLQTPLPTSEDDLLGALRGTPALRPAVDRGIASGLRAWLEDGVFAALGAPSAGSVRLSTSSIAGSAPRGGATALLRGSLVAQLVRLHVAGVEPSDPFDDAACALEASGRDDDLVTMLCDLDPDDHARLHAEVLAHASVLAERFPRVSPRWMPRCGVRQAIPLAGGGVQLRGIVDVALGASGGERANVCLIEVTTSVLEARHERVLAYLALLETLRTGETPLRVAAMSTADGAFVVHDVTPTLLAAAVGDVLQAVSECGGR